MAKEILSFRDVNLYTNDGEYFIEGLNFSLDEGGLMAFVGRYPTDVSTLWYFLQDCHDSFHYTGEIRVNGMPEELFRAKEGETVFVDSDRHLLDPFSVMDNMFLTNRAYYRASRAGKRNMYFDITRSLGIDIPPEALVKDLPIEEQMLVELLRVYVTRPRICVMHASLFFLTSKTFDRAIRILKAMREVWGTALIYCTTRYEDALSLPYTVTAISDGVVRGVFSHEEVRDNPKELLYCLSGWSELKRPDMAEAFAETHNILESTTELRKALEFLCESIMKVLEGRSAYVYLFGEDRKSLMDVGCAETEGVDERLRTDFVMEQCSLEDIAEFGPEREDYIVSFLNSASVEGIGWYLISPVCLREETAGFVQVNFDKVPLSKEDRLQKRRLLDSFSREVGIAIETSRLIGKSVLLQESHHRIKNNLQVIINLLFIHKLEMEKEYGRKAGEVFDALINQVKSIAVVHDLLSQDKLGKSYISMSRIIDKICGFYSGRDISFDLTLEDLTVPYSKAAQIALIANELIANSVKYAFQDVPDTGKRISICCESRDASVHLCVRDNGAGFSELPGDGNIGMGMNIILTTVQKMEGEVLFSNDKGAVVEIRIPREGIYDVG